MDDDLKHNLSDPNIWVRLLFMLFFAVAWAVAETVIALAALFQFFCALFTGGVNEPLLKFGRNLGSYLYEIVQFQTFNTERRPFPFSDWPDAMIDPHNVWLDDPDEGGVGEEGDRDEGGLSDPPRPVDPEGPRDRF